MNNARNPLGKTKMRFSKKKKKKKEQNEDTGCKEALSKRSFSFSSWRNVNFFPLQAQLS